MNSVLGSFKSDRLWRAGSIVDYARQAVESFYGLFNDLTKERGSGTTSNVEQDLLRAMVVFAGAGLDATLKQIVKDALPDVLRKSRTARENFEKFTVRYLCRTEDTGDEAADLLPSLKRIASLMAEDSPRQALIDLLVEERTNHSLQSGEELMRTVSVLGVTGFNLNTKHLNAFVVRNDIVHEMDVQFPGEVGKRNRKQRSRDEMYGHASALLETSICILEEVDKVLSA